MLQHEHARRVLIRPEQPSDAADELNFTRAARRLHVVPQALSTAIAQLEDILGVRLFDRTRVGWR
jgi:DNA-binding transcriptional LysR family regulator